MKERPCESCAPDSLIRDLNGERIGEEDLKYREEIEDAKDHN
jgi:hypothetical protein